MPNQTDGSSDATPMTETAGIPSVQTAPNSIYAAIRSDSLNSKGSSAPQWKKVIRIDRTANGAVSTVVQDYKIAGEVAALIQQAMIELADSDDTPEEQQYLMTAWQALAMYLASCDDEDKNGAAIALKQVSDLMSGANASGGPFPDGTFGRTVQTAAAVATPGAGSGTNKTTFDCAMDSRTFSTMQGLISHLQTAHQMSSVKARSTAMKAASK